MSVVTIDTVMFVKLALSYLARAIDLDEFTPHRFLYWIGMKSNSLEIRKFVADYFLWKMF